MLSNVRYRLHGSSREKLTQAESVVQKFIASPRGRLQIAIHEASHRLVANELGLTSFYTGPSIEQEQNDFGVTLGAVHLLSSETDKLTTQDLARLLVSGRVGERVLLQTGNQTVWSEDDFRSFVLSGRGAPADLIAEWKQAEECLLRELSSDLERQRKIIHEAATYEQQIFGIDRSVKV